jgi:hypothetical protein
VTSHTLVGVRTLRWVGGTELDAIECQVGPAARVDLVGDSIPPPP